MSRAIFDAPTIFPREWDRRDGQRNVDEAPVLALPDSLEVPIRSPVNLLEIQGSSSDGRPVHDRHPTTDSLSR
jgi:hypothetical protein